MSTYVLYHSRCIDGFGAAWAARQALGDKATYVAVYHGGPLPKFETRSHIIMVDFCLKRDGILSLLSDDHEVTILDHHKTAVAELSGIKHENLFVEFDMDRSGSVITWNYFHPGKPVPVILQWIQDRDLWRWELPETDAATEALMTYDYNFDVWDKIFAEDAQFLTLEGLALVRAREKTIGEVLGRVYFSDVGGHKVPVVNTDSYISNLLNRVCAEYPDYPFAAAWNMRANGSRKWSLRSIGDFDVSKIAANFGGGGHKNAAGFTTP